jgi:hypothetical protein
MDYGSIRSKQVRISCLPGVKINMPKKCTNNLTVFQLLLDGLLVIKKGKRAGKGGIDEDIVGRGKFLVQSIGHDGNMSKISREEVNREAAANEQSHAKNPMS